MDLVAAVSGLPVTAIDEGLGSGVLVADGPLLSFRHELARLAVEVSTPQAEQIAWHSRALTELRRRRSRDDRRLTYHAVRCGDRAAIAEYAPRAAARAAHLGAHREAAEQYRVALQWSDAQGIDRARLLDLRAYECYLTDQTESARESRREALTLYKEAGAEREVGVTQRWLSRLSWFLGENGESERYAADAVQTLEPLGEDRELAMAYSNMAQLRMLDRDPAGAVDWGTRALTLARRVGDLDVEIHALNNVGSALSYGDDITEGGQLLNRSLTLALLEDAQEHAARAYTNLGCTAVANRDFPDGIRLLRTGIGYCADHDLDSWRLYMSAWLAWSLAEQGQYAAAEQTLSDVRRHPDLSPITRITALVVAGQLAGRRGLDGSAALDRALTLARITGEAQRLVPVAVARAEAAWLDGRMADIAPEIDHAWPAALEHPVGWELGELLWWLKVAGVNRPVPVPLPPPFARLIEGRYHEAAQEWRSRGAPMWTALALGSADELPAAREGIEILDSLGLGAVREAVLRDRHARGQVVPRGPRPSSRANPNGLTAREIEVLGLLAQGLSNADLAARLYLSEKTVGHHVSALLRKLGEPTRSKAVASALRRGIVQPK
jgi:DNA-binding CsgD family transcriptional regulator/tetratricopeptide (TPR) repeat protein